MKLSFEICTIKQLDSLVKISRETFINAFEKENDPVDFKNYMDSAFSRDNIKAQLLNANSTFYFSYYNNVHVGYFKLNVKDAQNEQFEKPSMELERIYVLENFQGKQIGKQILLKIIKIAQEKKVSFLWLGVWQKNTAAIRFYERYGFKKFGEHPYYLGNDKQTDLLLKICLK